MNSGGAHCLKYGVTTNNVLGVRMVMMDGEIVDFGGPQLDPEGYDFLALIVGSEGQFGIITEATVRILKAAEGARPMMLGFDSRRQGRHVRGAHHRLRHHSRRHRVHGQARDQGVRGLRQGRLSARRRSAADRRSRGLRGGDRERLAQIVEIARAAQSIERRRWPTAPSRPPASGRGARPRSARIGRLSDYLCMDGTIPLSALGQVLEDISTHLRVAWAKGRQHLPRRRRQPASADHVRCQRSRQQADKAELAGAEILKLCVSVGGCLTGEHGVGVEKRDLMHVQFSRNGSGLQMRIKTVFDPRLAAELGQGVPARYARSSSNSRRRRGSCRLSGGWLMDIAGASCVNDVLKPATDWELQGMVEQLAARGLSVEVVGNGTKRAGRAAAVNGGSGHHSGMRGIAMYEPTELVMSARAGTPLSQIEVELAARGQMLRVRADRSGSGAGHVRRHRKPSAPCSPATCPGARRISAGAARDHLLGIKGVNGRGEIVQIRRPGDEERNRAGRCARPRRQLGNTGGHDGSDVQGAADAGRHRHTASSPD